MKSFLHILCSEPDDNVRQFIEAIAGDSCIEVICLYDDGLTGSRVDWARLVDDIFSHRRVICWS